jgi:transcriptional regulator GlxA family with amidase domain
MTGHICIYSYPGAMSSALAGIQDLFAIANRLDESAKYRVEVVSSRQQCNERPDVVIVPPCISTPLPDFNNPSILQDLREFADDNACMVASCAGVFYLAQAGLLQGKTVTTHWALFDELSRRYPEIQAIDRRNMVVDQGNIVTAAGLYAYQDLVLHILARFSGYTLAKQVADFALLDFDGRLQSYYARFQPVYDHGDDRVLRAQRYCNSKPTSRLSVSGMADAASLSERMLSRRFKHALNMAPGQYLIQLRVEKARQLLETNAKSIQQIAEATGYNDMSNFIRAFRRVAGVTPAEFRNRQLR